MATDTNTHPLSHLIPAPDVRDRYIPRRVGGTPVRDLEGAPTGDVTGGHTDLNVLKYLKDRSQTEQRIVAARLVGPTGSGKTFVPRALAAQLGVPLVTLSGSDGFDPSVLWGRYINDPDEPKRIIWQWSDAALAVQHGGIIVLDEVNFWTGDQTAAFHSLLDDRRGISVLDLGGKWVDAHPDLWVVATYNDGYEGTKRLNAAFANRFQVSLEWGYDNGVELALCGSPTLIGVANEIRALERTGAVTTPVPTNALVEFAQLAYDVDVLFALESFLVRFPSHERASIRERVEVEGILRQISTEVASHYEGEG